MRNVRLILAIALAFGGAMSMAASQAEAQKGGMRGGGKAGMRGGKSGMRGAGGNTVKRGPFGQVQHPSISKINPLKINNVPGVGPGYRGRNTVHGFIPTNKRLHGSAFYGAVGGFGGGGGGGWGGYGYGNGFGNFFERPYANGRIPTPPYFSIHPPVYYSYAVPRTYGHSPFAYPGVYRTPDVVVEPVSHSIDNPYVEQTKTVESKADGEPTPGKEKDDDFAQAEPQPQTIVNPYVDHPSQFPPAFEMQVTVADD